MTIQCLKERLASRKWGKITKKEAILLLEEIQTLDTQSRLAYLEYTQITHVLNRILARFHGSIEYNTPIALSEDITSSGGIITRTEITQRNKCKSYTLRFVIK